MTKIQAILDRILLIFSRITGLTPETSQIVLIVIISYIVWIYILIKIHRIFYKKKLKAQQECTLEYDTILYLIAQEEYKNQTQTSNSPIQKLFETKNYLQSHTLFIDAIKKLESETNHILLTPEMEKKIHSLKKKISTYNIIQKIFGLLISLATAWIYLLFW